jgi:predicted DNA-binding protein YlxM (UPF0122 family)
MRYNQDLSLGEIAQDLGVSRQAVCDNLNRTEALLRNMEENIGYVQKDLKLRKMLESISDAARELSGHTDPAVSALADRILSSARMFEE